jgi:hypothetical protein
MKRTLLALFLSEALASGVAFAGQPNPPAPPPAHDHDRDHDRDHGRW